MSNTITAIATPLGSGAVSIIRLSGNAALEIADKVFTAKALNNFSAAKPNYMYLGAIKCEGFYDQCLAVYFKAPHSYTGEDLVEFQCHGGTRLAQEVLKTLISEGAVIAEKGEFTKRAFLNGKLNLSEAEGIIDMITSENIAGLNSGYRLLKGHLSKKIEEINDEILDLTASLEASLDYPEELEEEVRSSMVSILQNLHISIKEILSTAKIGRYIKNGINIAIIGAPNIGKSSLLNAILGRDRAIVTDIEGTTRDTLEERVEVNGIFLNFIDTAGIRNTDDAIEKIGVDKAYESAKTADLILFLLDSSKIPSKQELNLINSFKDKRILKVFNKSDLGILPSNKEGIFISALTKSNIDLLLNTIVEMFVCGEMDSSGNVLTNLRHIDCLARALDSIKSASYSCEESPTECIIIDLKTAYSALGEITGGTANEDIIDKVFSKFCLGK